MLYSHNPDKEEDNTRVYNIYDVMWLSEREFIFCHQIRVHFPDGRKGITPLIMDITKIVTIQRAGLLSSVAPDPEQNPPCFGLV